MNVYLVTYDYYDLTCTLGIFSTKDKAEQEIANFQNDQMKWGLYVPRDDEFQIDEIPLDKNLEM